jgi:hypothetical protein
VDKAVVGAILGAWLAATLALALRGSVASRFVLRRDVFRLGPTWSFFAPAPGTFDYLLLARGRTSEGSTGPFVEIHPADEGLRRAVWHPSKRVMKTVFDCAQTIATRPPTGAPEVEYTLAYLTLLRLAASRLELGGWAKVQFVILRSAPVTGESELVIRSRFHPAR